MKKSLISALLIAFIMLMCFGCASQEASRRAITEAYLNEGYKQSNVENDLTVMTSEWNYFRKMYLDELTPEKCDYTVHLLEKGFQYAVLFEFSSEDALQAHWNELTPKIASFRQSGMGGDSAPAEKLVNKNWAIIMFHGEEALSLFAQEADVNLNEAIIGAFNEAGYGEPLTFEEYVRRYIGKLKCDILLFEKKSDYAVVLAFNSEDALEDNRMNIYLAIASFRQDGGEIGAAEVSERKNGACWLAAYTTEIERHIFMLEW